MIDTSIKKFFVLLIIIISGDIYFNCASFTVQFRPVAKVISYYSVQKVRADENGQIIIKKSFPVPVNIKSIRIYKDGRYYPCRYKIKKDILIVHKTQLKDEQVDFFLDYNINLKIFRHLFLPGYNLFIPMFIFQPDLRENDLDNADCYLEMPKKWTVLSPRNYHIETEQDDNNLHYYFSGNWYEYPVILSVKNIELLPLLEKEEKLMKDFPFYGKKGIRLCNKVNN